MSANLHHASSRFGESRLGLASANFKPLARWMERLGETVKTYDEAAALELREPMHEVAQNLYEVRYCLRHPDEARLSLTFFVTGDHADLLLLQAHERSHPRDLEADPGQLDQQTYRLDQPDMLKSAVQEKVSAHLRARKHGARDGQLEA